MRTLVPRVLAALAAVLPAGGGLRGQESAPATATLPAAPAASLGDRARKTVDRGIEFLKQVQDPATGAFRAYADRDPDVGITALCLAAFATSHRKYREDDGPMIRRPVEYLLARQKPDGSIHDGALQNYCTAISILALTGLGNQAHAGAVERAAAYLRTTQADESEGYTTSDRFYGGVGYGSAQRPDLSNAQTALEAAAAAGVPKQDEFFRKALVFLQRCQNRSESNDQTWKDENGAPVAPGNDGGAMYYPGNSMAGIEEGPDGRRTFRSYGSMSYALLKSYLFCDLSPSDERVRSVLDWVRKNYTLDWNPGFEHLEIPNARYMGLFYYYYTLAKALDLLGEETIRDADGREHAWRRELAMKLLALQAGDGSFANAQNGRWWEDSKTLCTAYALLALQVCLKGDLK